LSDSVIMTGNDFIKRVRAIAKNKGVASHVDKKRGKGSHVLLYYDNNKTTVRNPKDELKKGTLHAMIKQLGLEPNDFQ